MVATVILAQAAVTHAAEAIDSTSGQSTASTSQVVAADNSQFLDCGPVSPSYAYLNEIMPTLSKEQQLILDPKLLEPAGLYDSAISSEKRNRIRWALECGEITPPPFKQNSIDTAKLKERFGGEELACWAKNGDQFALVAAPAETRPSYDDDIPPESHAAYAAQYADEWTLLSMSPRESEFDPRCMARFGSNEKCLTGPFRNGVPSSFYKAYLGNLLICEEDPKKGLGGEKCRLAFQYAERGFPLGNGVLFRVFYNYEDGEFHGCVID